MIRLYRWALVARVFAGLVGFALTLYFDLPIVEDARFYEEIGHEVAQDWLSGRTVDFANLPPGAQSARFLVGGIAAFYYATGGVRALPFLLVVFCAITALVPVYVYRFARELQASEAVAKRAGWLVALSPAFVFWSGSLYKEGLTLVVLSAAAYHTLRLQSGWRARSVAVLVGCVVALWGVRFYLSVLLALAVALGLFWGRGGRVDRSRNFPRFVRQGAVILVFVAVVASLGAMIRTEHVLLESDEGVLVDLDVRRAGSAREARSGYLREASIGTPEEAIEYFPVGLFYFLTVPLPWQLGSIRQHLIIPENTFWLGLYPLMVIGIRQSLKTNRPGTVFLLLLTGGMCIVYALLTANIGTAYRMRSQVWVLLAPFASWGWEVWHERQPPTKQWRGTRRDLRIAGVRSR